jgi:hypothetical protein
VQQVDTVVLSDFSGGNLRGYVVKARPVDMVDRLEDCAKIASPVMKCLRDQGLCRNGIHRWRICTNPLESLVDRADNTHSLWKNLIEAAYTTVGLSNSVAPCGVIRWE